MPAIMNAPNSQSPSRHSAGSWRVRLRLFYRAWRYRWKNDPAEIAYVRRNVRPNTIALDIGAHKGGYTYWIARSVGRQGRVYAFEPQPELARKLAMAFDPTRVLVVNAGVSDRDGTMQLHVPSGDRPSPGASLVTPREPTATSRTLDVRVIQLDSFLSGRVQPVSFIKCDVEGHELAVFRGAEQLLRRDRPTLLFECEQRHHGSNSIREVFDFLHALGFVGHYFTRGQLAPLAEFDPGRDQRTPGAESYCNNFVFTASGDTARVMQ